MPTRSETLKLRLTTQELELYKSRAGAFGMTLSDWIRARCDSGPASYSPAGVTAQIDEKLRPDRLDSLMNLTASLAAPPTSTGSIVFESEKLLSRSRKELCPHRRRPDEYCVKCDG